MIGDILYQAILDIEKYQKEMPEVYDTAKEQLCELKRHIKRVQLEYEHSHCEDKNCQAILEILGEIK
jgi:hypothetical protein